MTRYKVISVFGVNEFEKQLNDFCETHDIFTLSNFEVSTIDYMEGVQKKIKFYYSIIITYDEE